MIFNFFLGLGPGGVKTAPAPFYFWEKVCIPGSSHGGIALTPSSGRTLHSDSAYDKDNNVSLLGGSGGEINYYLITFIDQSQQLLS